jgi:trimethylamine--corrinoid protein Co-methyltransferase
MKLYFGIASDGDELKEIKKMHECSLRILSEIGAVFHSPEAVEIFKAHGARTENGVVYIDEKMVDNALKSVPERFDWYGCNGEKISMGDGQTHILPAYGPIYVYRDGKYENASHEHFVNMHKLSESSDVMGASNANIIDVSYVNEKQREKYRLGVTLKYCRKPLMGLVEGAETAQMGLDLMRRFYGVTDKDKVISLGLIDTLGPMRLTTAMTEATIVYARNGQALQIGPGQTFGMTSPQSLAATQTLGNAMILATIVLSQLVRPGTPVIYSSKYSGDDMRLSSAASYGAIEGLLVGSAGVRLARYYGLPVHSGSGNTDSKVLDYQAGAESFMGLCIAYFNNVDCLFQSCGLLDSMNSISYEKFLLDEEYIRAFKRLITGFEADDNTLMFETMKKCGPAGQLFERTQKTYKRDCFMPEFAVRDGHSAWLAKGCQTAESRAAKACIERLENYREPETDKEQKKILDMLIPEKYR